MSDQQKRRFGNLIRFISLLAVIALFVADYGFGVMAKSPPLWAYGAPSLLALGIEGPALARLVVQLLRASAGIQQPPKE